jgi:hypothetical protein
MDSKNSSKNKARFSTRNRAELEILLSQSLQHIEHLNALVTALLNSKSWLLTRPLRATLDTWHRLSGRTLVKVENYTAAPEPIARLLTQQDVINATLENSCDTAASRESSDNEFVDDFRSPAGQTTRGANKPRGIHSDNKSPLESWFS